MSRVYIGVEFSHDKIFPKAKLKLKSRFGPLKRWVDDFVPRIVDGILRERVCLLMPDGFRFQKDVVKNRQGNNPARTYADGKFAVVIEHAVQKYLPYKDKAKALAAATPEATHGANKGTTEVETEEVQAAS